MESEIHSIAEMLYEDYLFPFLNDSIPVAIVSYNAKEMIDILECHQVTPSMVIGYLENKRLIERQKKEFYILG